MIRFPQRGSVVPSTVGGARVVSSAGTSVHHRLAVAFRHGVSVRLLGHELRAHAPAHARATARHHMAAGALTWTHGCSEHLVGHSRRGVLICSIKNLA